MRERDPNILGTTIQQLRRQRGLTVRQLADMVARSPGYLSRIEVRGEIPSPELIPKLAEALRVPPEQLVNLAARSVVERTKKKAREKYEAALALYRKSQ